MLPVNDYLKSEPQTLVYSITLNEMIVRDIDISSETHSPALKKPSNAARVGQPTSQQSAYGDYYVWDVFYHRPATLSDSECNEAANL